MSTWTKEKPTRGEWWLSIAPDKRIYDPAVYVDNEHSDMTLDVVAAKVAARAARIHKGRKRTKAAPMKAPAKKAKAKR